MRGNVYLHSVDGETIEPHPHVVVIVIGKECLVVPAYTTGKHMITEKITALKQLGYREDQVCVHLDNSIHVENCAKWFKGHPACWFTYYCYWAAKRDFELMDCAGTMSKSGMEHIAQALLQLGPERPGLLSEKHIQNIKRWIPSK